MFFQFPVWSFPLYLHSGCGGREASLQKTRVHRVRLQKSFIRRSNAGINRNTAICITERRRRAGEKHRRQDQDAQKQVEEKGKRGGWSRRRRGTPPEADPLSSPGTGPQVASAAFCRILQPGCLREAERQQTAGSAAFRSHKLFPAAQQLVQ